MLCFFVGNSSTLLVKSGVAQLISVREQFIHRTLRNRGPKAQYCAGVLRPTLLNNVLKKEHWMNNATCNVSTNGSG